MNLSGMAELAEKATLQKVEWASGPVTIYSAHNSIAGRTPAGNERGPMIQTMMDSIIPEPSRQSHPVLLLIGSPLILITGILVWRTVWEATTLSLESGPQMIGFSLAHGPFAVFFLVPLLLMAWFIPVLIVTVIALWRRRRLSGLYWTTISLAALFFILLALPPVFWQYMLIERFAKSPHAVDFMTQDAAEGYSRTVGAYLDHGISVDARGEYGTAANAAAIGGSVEVLQLLRSRQADLNAVDSSGKSPLSDAIEMKRIAATSYLKSQGALEIKPPAPPPGPADITVTP